MRGRGEEYKGRKEGRGILGGKRRR